MAFEIVAKRDSETVTMRRNSSLMAIAKARVWASEGWNVTIIVRDETALSAGAFLPFLTALPDRQPEMALAS